MQEHLEPTEANYWMEFLLQKQDTPAKLFENTFRAAFGITGLPVAEVVRLRHETHLRIEALADQIDIGYKAGQDFTLNDLLAGQIIEKRDAIVIPDILITPLARHPATLRFGIRSFIGTPIILDNKQLYGVLALCSRENHTLGKNELIQLSLLGRWLAHEIQLRKMHRELRSQNHRLSLLTQELQRLQIQVEQGSIRDPITDLLNSRYFNKVLQTETTRARRHAYPLTLLLLYPDGFQSIVRKWGMEATHSLLSSIGVLLRRHLRNIDNAARYNEELFAILLPQTDLSGATIVAERIRATIGNHRFSLPKAKQGVTINLTASIGIADLLPSEDDLSVGILSRARRALEQARSLGGNRVIVIPAKQRRR